MRHPYADFLHRVSKPARYIGGEYHQVVKEAADVRICMAFPDLYDIGMSHLGTKILYSSLNADPRIACERAFTPWPDMEAELRSRDLPLLSLETHRPLSEFDVVGISLQYEMTYTNVLTLLDLGGIPLRATDRSDDDPLVLGGGPTATHPEPVAPFFDAFLVGEGEEALPAVLLDYGKMIEQGMPRRERLVELARAHPYLYVPSLYELEEDPLTGMHFVSKSSVEGVADHVERAWVESLDDHPFPDDSPIPVAEAVFDRMSIEIARGCTEGCRFCQAGMIYRPVRERSPKNVVDTVLGAVKKGGFDETSLTSLSTADYSCVSPLIHEMVERLRDENVSLSVSSLRAYGLSDDLLQAMRSVRATGLTFAPEAGTQRMRDVVNKNVTEEDMLETARRVFSNGYPRMKVYFMIGLPTETDEDVAGIVETAVRARKEGRRASKGGGVEVNVSVSSHVPKPHTPFQWAAMDSQEEVRRKQALLRDLAKRERIRLKYHDAETSLLECICGRGDRRVADVIEEAWRRGCRLDGWNEHFRFDTWMEVLRESGLDLESFVGTIPVDARLPWDHIDVGLEDGFLLKEYRKALADRLSPPCGKPFRDQVHHTNVHDAEGDARKLVCYDCGIACDMTQMRQERIDFLESMGALTPPTPPVVETPKEPEAPAPPKSRKRPPVPPASLAAPVAKFRYRILYTKLGVERVTGHLDMIRAIPRIFRRAGVSVAYSQGFHPKPLFSFGPALSLGAAGFREPLEVALSVEMAEDELLRRLGDATTAGFSFVAARRLEAGEPKIDKIAATADYLVGLAGVELPKDWAGPGDLPARCAEVVAAESLPFVRKSKKGEKTLDLADAIVDVYPVQVEDDRLPFEGPALAMRLRVDLGWMARPTEVAALVLGEDRAVDVLQARLGIWGDAAGERLDLVTGDAVASPLPPRQEDIASPSLG